MAASAAVYHEVVRVVVVPGAVCKQAKKDAPPELRLGLARQAHTIVFEMASRHGRFKRKGRRAGRTIMIHPIVRMVVCDDEISSQVAPCWIVTRNLVLWVTIRCHLRHSGNCIDSACNKSRHTTSEMRNTHRNITQTDALNCRLVLVSPLSPVSRTALKSRF